MFVGEFSNVYDVCKEYRIPSIDGVVIFAGYDYEDYSGSSDVIFVKDGKFWHVEGAHCSCHGLEDQWVPVEMPPEALVHILTKGSGPMGKWAGAIQERIAVVTDFLGLDGASSENIAFALKMAFG